MLYAGATEKLKKAFSLSNRAFGKYKSQIGILTALGFLSGLLEGVGVNAIIPILSFFTGSAAGGDDLISRAIERSFAFLHIPFSLPALLIFVAVLFTLKAFVLLAFSYIKIQIQTDYEKETRDRLFRDTLAAKWPYLMRQRLGYLETTLINDVRNSAAGLEVISQTIMSVTGLMMYLLVALNISPGVTLLALLAGAVIVLVFKPLLSWSRQAAAAQAEMFKEVSRHVNENVLGVKTVKALRRENEISQIASLQFESLKRYMIRAFLAKSFATAFIQPLGILFIIAIFSVSYYTVGINLVSIASLAAIVYLINRIFSYIQTLQGNLHALYAIVPYLTAALAFHEKAVRNTEEDKGTAPFRLASKISFEGVSFSYGNEQKVLDGVSFSAKKGEMVGLIGLSGAGKTTIFDLMLRLFDPTEGKIVVDGTESGAIRLSGWREKIGYVSQEIFLTNDTIANNIRFYDESISEDAIKEAAEMANIHDFIQGLPDGFETLVGERGLRLSAGQRQRVAIARVLARKPEVLLLDEATSALDNESELKIQQAIENLRGKITVFIIAHRLGTVRHCDTLLVLEGGKIVERGHPDKLLKDKRSYFYKVYNIRE